MAEAYRHKGRSAYADAVIANRHADFFPAECLAAVDRVLVEYRAGLIAGQEERRLMGLYDSEWVARLHFLSQLTDEEFNEIRDAGLMEDLEP